MAKTIKVSGYDILVGKTTTFDAKLDLRNGEKDRSMTTPTVWNL